MSDLIKAALLEVEALLKMAERDQLDDWADLGGRVYRLAGEIRSALSPDPKNADVSRNRDMLIGKIGRMVGGDVITLARSGKKRGDAPPEIEDFGLAIQSSDIACVIWFTPDADSPTSGRFELLEFSDEMPENIGHPYKED